MAEMNFGSLTTRLEPISYERHSYLLKVMFCDEGTAEDSHRVVRQSFSSLLRDVDPDRIDLDDLSKDHKQRVKYEDDNLIPNSRREVTMALVQLALEELEDSIEFTGEVTSLVGVEVIEKTTIKDTPYDDMDFS